MEEEKEVACEYAPVQEIALDEYVFRPTKKRIYFYDKKTASRLKKNHQAVLRRSLQLYDGVVAQDVAVSFSDRLKALKLALDVAQLIADGIPHIDLEDSNRPTVREYEAMLKAESESIAQMHQTTHGGI